MATITEDYCSFELSKLLKEKGFNEPCYRWYDNKGAVCAKFIDPDIPLDYSSRDYYLCPSQSVAMKWLREVHDVHIDVSIYVITKNMLKYNINVYYKKHKNDSMYLGIHLTKEHTKYEKACEAAVLYCLENLI